MNSSTCDKTVSSSRNVCDWVTLNRVGLLVSSFIALNLCPCLDMLLFCEWVWVCIWVCLLILTLVNSKVCFLCHSVIRNQIFFNWKFFLWYSPILSYVSSVMERTSSVESILLTKVYTRYTDMHFSRRSTKVGYVGLKYSQGYWLVHWCSRQAVRLVGQEPTTLFESLFDDLSSGTRLHSGKES